METPQAQTEPESLRLAVAQMDCVLGDVDANLERIVALCEQAAAKRCELVLFPEMVDTGYDMPTISRLASPVDGEPRRRLAETARRLNLAIVCGLSLRTADKVWNTLAFFDSDGSIATEYRKTHLFSKEPACEPGTLTAGESLATHRWRGFEFGPMICYDVRFPEVARTLTLQGAEILLVPAAFPFPRDCHWKTLTECRAIENQAWLLAANRCGTDAGVTCCGNSRIVDPDGGIVAQASASEETLLVAEVSKQSIRNTRQGMRIFAERRPELYRS